MSIWATRISIDYVIGWWAGDYDATRDDNERHDKEQVTQFKFDPFIAYESNQ